MTTEFTKGPWNRNILAGGKYPTVFAGRNKHVAVVSQAATPEETEANINLIAASPELLQQLKLATDHIHDLRIILEQAAEMGLTLHMCGVTYNHDRALAAIAKAEGK